MLLPNKNNVAKTIVLPNTAVKSMPNNIVQSDLVLTELAMPFMVWPWVMFIACIIWCKWAPFVATGVAH